MNFASTDECLIEPASFSPYTYSRPANVGISRLILDGSRSQVMVQYAYVRVAGGWSLVIALYMLQAHVCCNNG